MSDPINIILVNLPPIEFTQAKSMRERAVEIYRDHLDHEEWRMDGARLGMAADIIEAQAKAIERVRAMADVLIEYSQQHDLFYGDPTSQSEAFAKANAARDILAVLEGKPA